MFSIQERITGKKYTQTATLLVLALVFIPGLAIFIEPSTSSGIVFAVTASALLYLWAAITWHHHSDATILSILGSKRVR